MLKGRGRVMGWVAAAVLSAFFAGVVSVLAKLGIQRTDSDVATAIRTTVVLAFAWLVVAVVGSAPTMSALTPRSWVFLGLSGLATGASWICYFRALSLGDVNRVVPIDKSSAVLATLLAIALLGETAHLAAKLVCTAVILLGTLLMIERREDAADGGREGRRGLGWLPYAILAAVFAALTSILGRVGIEGVESNLGTALRTCVVLPMSWAIVLLRGKLGELRSVDRRELGFLLLSGVATGASWLCYYRAIQTGVVSVVVQIDKLSILVSVAFAWLVLRETLTRRAALGLALMVAGTVAMTLLA
ncbi:EamA family transporter [Olsenella phocaeensis]|uniref:EamA family transporter n=1 Tax=Olsenella phocaeensis TaxID=1852385 RepID=UPI003A8EDA64